MATIMEGALWTLTEAAAERMVENGLIERCDNEHCTTLGADAAIYHRSTSAPDWFGFSTMARAIASAEAHVESTADVNDDLGPSRKVITNG